MIRTETITINGTSYVRTYSDAGRLIERGGVEYSEAIDPAGSGRTYVEGGLAPTTDEDYATAGRILLGVGDND